MTEVPEAYRKQITIDSKISSIGDITNIDKFYSRLPSQIRTVEDLFVKRTPLPSIVNNNTVNAISRAMNAKISVDDIDDELIETTEDLRLTLFALLTNGKVLDKNGNEGSIKNIFGKQIGGVSCGDNITYITRYESLNLMGITEPQIELRNILMLNRGHNYDVYVLTDATYDEIKVAPNIGLPENRSVAPYNSVYIHRVASAIGIDNIKDNLDNISFDDHSLTKITSDKYDLYSVLPPLKLSGFHSPWFSDEQINSFDIITQNNDLV